MTFQVTINGTDVSQFVHDIVRDVSMCEVSCGLVLQLDPRAPAMDPYHTANVDIDGERRFTGYVNGTVERRSGGKWVRQVTCDHYALKRLKDYFHHETFDTGNSDYVIGALIGYIADKAGVTINWQSGVADAPVPRNWIWTDITLMSFLMDLALFGGLQIVPEEDGTILLVKATINQSSYTSLGPIMASRERRVDDSLFRSGVAVYGSDGTYIASGSNPYGLPRYAIAANPMINTYGKAAEIGGLMLNEFNQLLDIEKTVIVGRHNVPVASTVLASDPKDGYSKYGIVTRVNDTYRATKDTGNMSTITTNERCPNIFGFDYTILTIYTHKALAVGISSGTPWTSGSGSVMITPDITKSWFGSGSGFMNGSACEWYDCSVGLSGMFLPNHLNPGGFDKWYSACLIRDVWSDEGRGAWGLTNEGVFYTPKLLPPSGQSSGSWDYTPWTKIYSAAFSTAKSSVAICEKANDSTGIYLLKLVSPGYDTTTPFITPPNASNSQYAEFCIINSPGSRGGLESYKISRTGATTLLDTFDFPFVPQPTSMVANLSTGILSYMTSYLTYEDGSAPNETDPSGNLLTPRYMGHTAVNRMYTGIPLVLLSTFSPWAYGGMSYDAKHERLYLIANGGGAVLRSDDHGVTFSTQSSGSSINCYGPITSRILANQIVPYISTYCISAVAGDDPLGRNVVYISPNDGWGYYTSGSFANPVRCIMDMDV